MSQRTNRRMDKPTPTLLVPAPVQDHAYSPRFPSTQPPALTGKASDAKAYGLRCTSRLRRVDAVPASSTLRIAGRARDPRRIQRPIAQIVRAAFLFSLTGSPVDSCRTAKAFLSAPTRKIVFLVVPFAAQFQAVPVKSSAALPATSDRVLRTTALWACG